MRTSGHDEGDVVGSLASLTQELPRQEGVGELSLMTDPGNRQAEMKDWIMPLTFGRDSLFSPVRKNMA